MRSLSSRSCSALSVNLSPGSPQEPFSTGAFVLGVPLLVVVPGSLERESLQDGGHWHLWGQAPVNNAAEMGRVGLLLFLLILLSDPYL